MLRLTHTAPTSEVSRHDRRGQQRLLLFAAPIAPENPLPLVLTTPGPEVYERFASLYRATRLLAPLKSKSTIDAMVNKYEEYTCPSCRRSVKGRTCPGCHDHRDNRKVCPICYGMGAICPECRTPPPSWL